MVSYSVQQQWTISWLDCDMWLKVNFIWQLAMASWERTPKHVLKQNLHQKKVMVTVWWSSGSLISYSFLNPLETITSENYSHINDMHWKLLCLQLALVNRKGPILLHNNTQLHVTQGTLQKLNKLGYKALPHLPYSSDLSPTDEHFFKHLHTVCGKMLPQT